MDRPFANDHLDEPASCKRSSELAGLLQMIIRMDQPLANDHPDLGRGRGGAKKAKKQLILICRLYKERILHKRFFFQILLRIGLYQNPVVLLAAESYSNLERCKNAENMQI